MKKVNIFIKLDNLDKLRLVKTPVGDSCILEMWLRKFKTLMSNGTDCYLIVDTNDEESIDMACRYIPLMNIITTDDVYAFNIAGHLTIGNCYMVIDPLYYNLSVDTILSHIKHFENNDCEYARSVTQIDNNAYIFRKDKIETIYPDCDHMFIENNISFISKKKIEEPELKSSAYLVIDNPEELKKIDSFTIEALKVKLAKTYAIDIGSVNGVVNRLYDAGNRIIITTKQSQSESKEVRAFLHNNNIKYHEIYYNFLQADFYINKDNKLI